MVGHPVAPRRWAALSTELSASPTFASICFVRLTWSSASFCVCVAPCRAHELVHLVGLHRRSVGQQESHVARRGGVGGEAAHYGAPTRLRGTDRTERCRQVVAERKTGGPAALRKKFGYSWLQTKRTPYTPFVPCHPASVHVHVLARAPPSCEHTSSAATGRSRSPACSWPSL